MLSGYIKRHQGIFYVTGSMYSDGSIVKKFRAEAFEWTRIVEDYYMQNGLEYIVVREQGSYYEECLDWLRGHTRHPVGFGNVRRFVHFSDLFEATMFKLRFG